MAKATKKSILEMITRHAEVYREMDRLYDLEGDGATDTLEYHALADEAVDLEYQIVATRATSRADIAAKLRFIRKTAFLDYKNPGLSTGNLEQLVEMTLTLDREAVRATVQPHERLAATA